MAKRASTKTAKAAKPAKAKAAKKKSVPAKATARTENKSSSGGSEAVRKLLESPLVADLLAVGATAALAAIAEHGFGKGQGKSTSKAIKNAGKAAAAAMGRRIGTEFDEIRNASKAKADAGSST